jgi:hypothetical protein
MLASFLVFLAPLLPMWEQNWRLAFPRADESMEAFRPSSGVNWGRMKQSVGEPFVRSLGWFFVVPDMSTQGTLTPGGNRLEATLFAVGIGLALLGGFSLNILLLAQLVFGLVILGAFGGSPPWYTRLVPTAPIAAVFAAAVLAAFVRRIPSASARLRNLAMAFAVLLALASAAWNLVAYVRYENGLGPPYRSAEMTFIGRRMKELGPAYRFYLVVTKEPYWTVDYARANGRLGELLPFIWNLRVTEIHELESRLPLPAGEQAAVVLRPARFEEDLALIRRWYPGAVIEEIRDFQRIPVAGLVRIESGSASVAP